MLYISSSAIAGGGIDNVSFINCRLGSTDTAISGNAFIRVNPSSLTGRRIGRVTLDGCKIKGNGGVLMIYDGTNQAQFTMRNCTWILANDNAAGVVFDWSSAGTYVDLDNVKFTIATGQTMATTAPLITLGRMRDCDWTGLAAAKIQWKDHGAGRTDFRIGYNTFSAYAPYIGVATTLDVTFATPIQSDLAGANSGVPFRVVHGGEKRVLNYISTPSIFLNQQAPIDGDITYNTGQSAASRVVVAYVYDSNLGKWRQCSHIVKKGSTGGRPSIAGTLTADVGIMYLDTTLDADGKPIWWTGTAWVDATGAVV